jgi:hypothetical protein
MAVMLPCTAGRLQVYISVGKVAKQHLTPQRIAGIVASMKPLLRTQRYGAALERATVQIGLVLADSKDALPAGGGGAEQGSDRSSWWDYTPIAGVGAVIAFVQGRGWRQRRRRSHVTRHLRRLQKDMKARHPALFTGKHQESTNAVQTLLFAAKRLILRHSPHQTHPEHCARRQQRRASTWPPAAPSASMLSPLPLQTPLLPPLHRLSNQTARRHPARA